MAVEWLMDCGEAQAPVWVILVCILGAVTLVGCIYFPCASTVQMVLGCVEDSPLKATCVCMSSAAIIWFSCCALQAAGSAAPLQL